MIETTSLSLRGPAGVIFLARQLSPERLAPLRWYFVPLTRECIQEIDTTAIHAVLHSTRQTRTWRPGTDPFTSVLNFAWELLLLIDPNAKDQDAARWNVATALLPLIVRNDHALTDPATAE